MKFLSDILAKAGLTVDGVVTLNNTATGQTPDANDNSTKLATTAWVRGFVTPYTLPIASGTTLGGIKIGSGLSIDGTGIVSVAASGVGAIRALQQLTATAGQTVFTVSGGYTPGLIDVFLNGVLLTPTAIDSSNGNTFTLADGAIVGDLLDVFVYNPIYNGFISSTDQVPEGDVNLYYTDARARAAISLTTNGNSGAATYIAGVLNIPNYQGLVPAGGVAGDILAKVSGTNYDVTWIPNYTSQVQHIVKAAVAVTKGQAVYVSSSDGTNMIVSKASNAAEQTSSKTLGLVAQDLALNGQGFVVTEGLLAGLDTSTAQAGDPVWLGTNGNLIFGLVNKPTAPAHLVFIGIVTRVQSNNGEIFVKVQNGFELDELHNLSVASPSDGDMIKYVASTGLWTKIAATTTNITEGTNLYYTDARARAAISVTGSGSYDSATGVITVTGGVTSVNTLTGAVTLTTSNIAEGTNLYYTDARVNTYLTANNYATQSYVGTAIANLVASAPATLDTLNELATALGNDPNFATTITVSIGTKVPQTRTITINGTAYDLSADRSWTIASGVTSFNTRTGDIIPTTGDYTTAQVTESGNLYFTNTRARSAISLTTTGTSGAATYDSATGVLNIPQYQGGVTSFNTRTGAITLTSTDVTDALGFTPASSVSSSARTIQTFIATANQTTFTVTGGYVPGLVDVYINGIKLATSDYTATNGTTIVLGTGTGVNNIVEVVRYNTAFTATNALRQITYFTATAGQTVFTVTYNPGLVDVFYNGSKLAASDYTASNGTSVVLGFAATLNDTIEVVAYSYAVGAYTGQAQLNGTGFVKVNGTTVSYDNSTYALDSAVVKLAGSQTITGDKTFQGTQKIDNDLLLKNVSGSPTTATGYTSIRGISGIATGVAYKGLSIIDTAMWGASLRFATDNAYDYTFPATSGTVALLSNLTSYLPLTGGTLTGGLTGTTATFSSDVFALMGVFTRNSADTFIGSSNNTSGIKVNGSTLETKIVSGGNVVATFANSGAATFANFVQATGKLFLQRQSNGADTLIQFKNEVGTDRAYINFGGTNEELGFYAGNGSVRNMIIGSDGAMGFNYSTLAVRSFMFRALSGRPLAIEVAEAGGVHSLYFRPNSSGRHLITSNYLSGGVYLPLALSGRENDSDLVLNNGSIGIGVYSPGYKLDVQNNSGGVFGATMTGGWTSGYLNHSSFMAPSLTGGAVSIAIGVANSTYNVGKLVFNYSGNSSISNSVGLGFWDNDNVLRVLASGQVYIGSPTNPGNGLSISGSIQAGRSNGSFLDPGSTGNVLGGTTFFVPASYDGTNNGYIRIQQDSSTIQFVTDWDGHITGGTLKTIIFKHGQAGNGVQLTPGSTSWSSYTSDARTKTIHETLVSTGLDTISKLNGVKYTMSKVDPKYGPDTKLKIGFTAQNIQEAIPEAVFVSYQDDDLGDVLTYTPDYIVPYLVEAIKELKTQNSLLKERLDRNNLN